MFSRFLSSLSVCVTSRTSGASKNRDWRSFFFVGHLSFFRILKLLRYFGTYGMYTYTVLFWTNFLDQDQFFGPIFLDEFFLDEFFLDEFFIF